MDSPVEQDHSTGSEGNEDADCTQSRAPSEQVVIAKTESKHVCYLKSLLVSVLVLVAAGVSISVYSFAKESEKNDFETQYFDHAHKVTSSFQANARMRLRAIESFAVAISNAAQARGG